MTHQMIGTVLQGRYQIVQSLGAGVFGQTYIAVDVKTPENPKCVVKQLKVTSSQPSYLQNLRLRFLTETETLKHLGHHDQIPQLITCFEEHERFYLVQEFIEGHSLTAELPVNPHTGYLWGEAEVVKFLQDVLSVLEFVHSHGVIHCDIKPENLIRRASDGKLILIDFGSIQPVDFAADAILPIYRVPATSLGYIPPEQFIGETKPNSDIYALGMIGIQALTGLAPLQLKVDPQTNEVLWRTSKTIVNDYLAAVLSQMVRYDFHERFQSVGEILRVLQQMPIEYQQVLDEGGNYVSLPSVEQAKQSQKASTLQPSESASSESSPLLVGMKVGLAANSLVIGFGAYSLVYNSPAYSETETLYKATEEYQSGDLAEAIALVKSIPQNSNVYPEAQATIEEWQNQWQTASEQYKLAEKAFQEGQWSEVLRTAAQLPDILYWQSKTHNLVEQATSNIERQTQDLLAKAYEKAAAKDFGSALDYLSQIPEESSAGALIQQKLAEYNQKKHVRAIYLLQKAYNQAEARDFEGALKFLQQVPKGTPVYTTAQAKLVEYTQKKQILEAEHQRIASLREPVIPQQMSEALDQNSSTMSLRSWEPGDDLLKEVNIR